MDISQVAARETKQETYELILKQAQSLFAGEPNWNACISNLCSLIHLAFDHHWTGVYLLESKELVLHNFQGPVACTRIQIGRGVCGKSFQQNKTVVVPNVHEFEDHIACSSLTNSEIVIPLHNANGQCIGVFDIDSVHLNAFDDVDQKFLEHMLSLLPPNPNYAS